MILLKKRFWRVFGATYLLFVSECIFAFVMLVIYFVLYEGTGYEPLNSFTAAVIFKIITIVPPAIYNFNKLIALYKQRDYLNVFALVSITVVYSLGVATLGGGGR